MKIPKTTVSLWTKNVPLTKEQSRILKDKTNRALQQGRVRAQKVNTEQRINKEKQLFAKGESLTSKLTQNELFVVGVALYWGEGFKNKHEHRLGFCNSDPQMITFYISWLEKAIHVKKEDLVARLTLNMSYQEKEKKIESYWSDITEIPLNQFTRPFYQHSQWKKQYKTDEYHGVLRVHVKNSLEYLWEMRGWIAGLKHAKIGNAPG
ncbi:MAG: hypothetical protein WD992_00180 [Candidatus Levyibacteriota bacterium]